MSIFMWGALTVSGDWFQQYKFLSISFPPKRIGKFFHLNSDWNKIFVKLQSKMLPYLYKTFYLIIIEIEMHKIIAWQRHGIIILQYFYYAVGQPINWHRSDFTIFTDMKHNLLTHQIFFSPIMNCFSSVWHCWKYWLLLCCTHFLSLLEEKNHNS